MRTGIWPNIKVERGMSRVFRLLLVALMPGLSAVAQSNITPWLDANNVTWNVPGPTSAESMPLGNGDIGLNVWVETNGSVLCYIAKTDAWNQNNWWQSFDPYGLMKVGGVRVSLNPPPLSSGTNFLQTL